MHYHKINLGETLIEFHNNWLGEETVIINGQIVSKKSSVWGTNHYFTTMEDGHVVRYILTTKINEHMQVVLDLSKNGKLVEEDILVKMFNSKIPTNKAKKQGLIHLKEYDLLTALKDFEKALEHSPKDPEVYFHMACAYSVLEKTVEGFDCLKKAVACNLQDLEMILNHDMLAFLRMNEAFEGFLESNYTEYDEQLLLSTAEAIRIDPRLNEE